jgi:putative ABC transport system permease protein
VVPENRPDGSSRENFEVQGLETVASALLTLSLVAAAIAISRYQRLDLERDIAIAVVRSFVQLTAIGYAINLVFGLESLLYVILLLIGMVAFASWTSAGRGKGVSGAFPISVVAIGVAAATTLGVLLALQIVPPTARYLIPLGGMVIGNSMNTASLTLGRIRDDVNAHRLNIEAALALGATKRQAISPVLKTALQNAMTPLIDATKTTGLIFLPGAMAGMIIGGADPLEAVRLQLVVMYMLLGSVSISAILVGLLSYRSFFTPRHQLRTAPPES